MTIHEYAEKYLTEVKDLLIIKNKNYGNSALLPINIFSTGSNYEQIKVRIDDKLCRLANRNKITDTEDTVKDLLGYLFLLDMAYENRMCSSSFEKLLDNTFTKYKKYMADYQKDSYNNVYIRIAFPELNLENNADMITVAKINFVNHLQLIVTKEFRETWYKLIVKDLIIINYYEKLLKGEFN